MNKKVTPQSSTVPSTPPQPKPPGYQELWYVPFLIVTLVCLLTPIVWYSLNTQKNGMIGINEKRKVETSLEDVSSLFTNHLTTIGLLVTLASAVVVMVQIHFQRQEGGPAK